MAAGVVAGDLTRRFFQRGKFLVAGRFMGAGTLPATQTVVDIDRLYMSTKRKILIKCSREGG